MQNNSCNKLLVDKNGYARNCKLKCKNGEKFCHKHKNTVNIDIKMLDNDYIHNLLGLYDSWGDMDINDIILMDGEYWNIEIIASHFTRQLNNSNMENPYPIYPNSPCNRKHFSVESLVNLKNKLVTNNKKVNISLKLLLNQNVEILNEIYDNVDKHSFSSDILNLFKENFRFMLINNKNSQNIYNGLWVNKNEKLTKFELLYKKLSDMPYQIIMHDFILVNIGRDEISDKMDKCGNDYNMFDKKVCESF